MQLGANLLSYGPAANQLNVIEWQLETLTKIIFVRRFVSLLH